MLIMSAMRAQLAGLCIWGKLLEETRRRVTICRQPGYQLPKQGILSASPDKQNKPIRTPEAHVHTGLPVSLQKRPAFHEVQLMSKRVGPSGKKEPFVWRTCENIPSEACNFPTDHPGHEDKPECQKALPLPTQPTFKRQFLLFVVPRESSLNGFTMCRLFWRAAGSCCLLPESEQRQTPMNPTEVEVTLPALTPGLENPCKRTLRGHGI